MPSMFGTDLDEGSQVGWGQGPHGVSCVKAAACCLDEEGSVAHKQEIL